VFVGEAPGFNEDLKGRPFVGQAGALLEDLLKSIYWSRGEVFITNVVKCRPPGNRDPEPDEIAACGPYLARQLEALDPALVVTLGRFSMARFSPGARIGQVHGTFRAADAGSGSPRALTFAMYHPAAALHQASLRETLFTDMAGVPGALTDARARRAADRLPMAEATPAAIAAPAALAANEPPAAPTPPSEPSTGSPAAVAQLLQPPPALLPSAPLPDMPLAAPEPGPELDAAPDGAAADAGIDATSQLPLF
jgi:DNA polymerase